MLTKLLTWDGKINLSQAVAIIAFIITALFWLGSLESKSDYNTNEILTIKQEILLNKEETNKRLDRIDDKVDDIKNILIKREK
jgi:hypothetical protein